MTSRRGQDHTPHGTHVRPHRRLRADRRWRDRGPGLARRLGRLALRAPLRLRGVLRGAAGRARAWALGLAPRDTDRSVRRRYRDDTLVLETNFETDTGAVTLVDCMPQRDGPPVIVRKVVGLRGTVAMRMELVIRTDYGAIVPWVRRSPRGIRAVAGPDALLLTTDVALRGEGLTTVADFTVSAGERIARSRWRGIRRTVAVPGAGRRRRGRRGDRARGGGSGPGAAPTRAPMARRGAALPDHAQGDDLRAHRRDRRRADHVAARAASAACATGTTGYCWLRDATFTLYALILRLSRRGARLAPVAAPRRRRHPRPAPDHVRPRRRAPADRARAAVAPRLRRAPRRCASATRRTHQFQLDVYGEVLDALYAGARRRARADDA